ncbi:hypothetical protein SAMN05216553_107385 [Lentzea fradiae]|uniref:Uncharacterized protein n=1 Tax=Lentzea fradiae TaxID=200378 RepID=A0A1G7TPU5_9PSEU|nr:hypothetical protein [Lentzea fradiae]SDG36994.1 hypothetical protein SAMN05216553_107385 [Lentzea fradiae]
MALFDQSVSVESWIEMTGDVEVRCEVDRLNEKATLYFGHRDEYVMVICRDGLGKVASLAARAVRELDAEPAPSS